MNDFERYANGTLVKPTLNLPLFRHFFALPAYHLVLVACAMLLLLHGFYSPVWLSILAFISLVAQLPFIKQKIAKKFSLKKFYQKIQLGVFVVGVIGLLLTFPQVFSTETSIGFLVLCLFCKLWELTNKRDAYVILNLCLFVLAAAFLWSQGLSLALMAVLALALVMLGFIALTDTHNDMGTGRLKTLGFLLLPSIPLLVVLFLFFPRLPPLWSLSAGGKQATTGVSDSMSPGDFANLSQSTELAFRVEFAGNPPKRTDLYWRGLVFTDFDGVAWTPSQTRSRYFRSHESPPDWATAISGQTNSSYRVMLEPTHQHWLYALDYSRPQPKRGIAISDKFTLGSYDPISAQISYQVDYYPNAKVGLELTPIERAESLALPDTGNPKARQLAQDLSGQAQGDTRNLVTLIHEYMLNNEFSYTLSPPQLHNHRIDEFLFGSKAGFCEHYASSFVFLMRSAGVPSRVVAGYQGGELGRDNASWEVRQMDAHAWAEIWIANEGWVRVDPTGFVAPNRILDGMNALTQEQGASMFGDGLAGQLGYSQFRMLQSIYRLSDQMGYYWQKQVVGFDQETQKNSLMQWFKISNLATQILIMVGAFFALLALLALVFWYRRRAVYHVFDAPIVQLSKRLAKKDPQLAKQPSESYLGYLKRLENLAQTEPSLSTEYRAYRFGQQNDGQYKDFAHQIRKFGQKFKAH